MITETPVNNCSHHEFKFITLIPLNFMEKNIFAGNENFIWPMTSSKFIDS